MATHTRTTEASRLVGRLVGQIDERLVAHQHTGSGVLEDVAAPPVRRAAS